MNSEKELKIIAQAVAHLDEITNSHSLRNRVHQAKEINTLDAFWDLHKDLTEPGETLNNLLRYKDTTDAIAYTRTLSAILRGEYLEK